MVTLRLLSTYHPWISCLSTTSHSPLITRGSAEYSWSHFRYPPLITRGSAGRVQLVTLLLLFTYHPWLSWQSTAGHTSVTLHSTPVCQLAEYSWSHFCYLHSSPVDLTLVILLLLSTRVISWKSTYGHTSVTSPLITRGSAVLSTTSYTSVTLHSSPVDQLAAHGSAGRVHLVTLLLLSTYHPWISWQSTAGHTSITLHSQPVDQLAEYLWSHFGYFPLITVDQLSEHN